jgi:hypothetical protein
MRRLAPPPGASLVRRPDENVYRRLKTPVRSRRTPLSAEPGFALRDSERLRSAARYARSGRIAVVRASTELTSAFSGIRASLSPAVSDVILPPSPTLERGADPAARGRSRAVDHPYPGRTQPLSQRMPWRSPGRRRTARAAALEDRVEWLAVGSSGSGRSLAGDLPIVTGSASRDNRPSRVAVRASARAARGEGVRPVCTRKWRQVGWARPV